MVRKPQELFRRKSLDEVCTVPDDIISVYVVEKHIWEDQGSEDARKDRQPEMRTVEEFLIDPVRPFLNDVFLHLAAPYQPDRRDRPIGQGHWIQAEFGSGKSHVLSFIGAMALGDENAWNLVKTKEDEAGRGKRDSLYAHWENGLRKKSEGKGVLVVVKTLVGAGAGTVGVGDGGKPLVEYILDAVQEQYRVENGRPLPLFPTELLVDRFLSEDLERYQKDLEKFLADPKFFDEEQQTPLSEFLSHLQDESSPARRRDCGKRLWQFYEDYLKTRPRIPTESEQVLEHAVRSLLEEGYQGLLLLLDEVSLFMKNRSGQQRVEDEKTLVVLSNRLVQVHNLPVWTVCAAQQRIESEHAGAKNIIANERLKLVPLLNEPGSYYDIALSRVRKVTDPAAPAAYFEDYRKAFSWPDGVGKNEFTRFFPFYPQSMTVVKAVSEQLTTVRSALYFMLQALKTARKSNSRELVTLWGMFDDVVHYEEDPSGTTQGITSIKTRWEAEWKAYETARQQLGMVTKGEIKRWLPRCEKILRTLFLHYVAHVGSEGMTAEEVMNSVMEWRDHEEGQQSDVTDNTAHYEILLDKVDLELPQVSKTDRGYVFTPVRTGVDFHDLFRKARSEAENSQRLQQQAWEFLLALNGWELQSTAGTRDLVGGRKSLFSKAVADGRELLKVPWHKREVSGALSVRNLVEFAGHRSAPLGLDTVGTDEDFSVYVSDRPCFDELDRLARVQKDARVLFWSPDHATTSELDLILDMAAFISIVREYKDQDTQDAKTVIDQVHTRIQDQLGKLTKVVPDRYGRGKLAATDHSSIPITMQGNLKSILQAAVSTVLDATYVSRDLDFSSAPAAFTDEEAIKVINGIVRVGEIPRHARADKNISAVQNYGAYLGIVARSNERKLDTSGSRYVRDIQNWVKRKVEETGRPIPVEALYKNFMGVGGPGNNDYGLSRRLIDLFLLCLVREGKVRISVDSRAEPTGFIDYGNIEQIDFRKATLQGMKAVSIMEAPEGWEVLRPFAALLLDDSAVEQVTRDAEIQQVISRLKAEMEKRREAAGRLDARLRDLFAALEMENPLGDRVDAWRSFTQAAWDSAQPVSSLLDALDRNFGYKAYGESQVRPEDRDDFAARLVELGQVTEFASKARELRAAAKYARLGVEAQPLKDELKPHLRRVRKSLEQMELLMTDPGKLAADLLDPLEKLQDTYATRYLQVFDDVQAATEGCREKLGKLNREKSAATLDALNGVSALESVDLAAIEGQIQSLTKRLFPASVRRAEVEAELRERPDPTGAGDLVGQAPQWLGEADRVAEEAADLYDSALLARCTDLASPGLRQLLEQAKGDAFIDALLEASRPEELAEVLKNELPDDTAKVELLDRTLRKVRVQSVSLAAFASKVGTIGVEDLDQVTDKFRAFLENELVGEEGETVLLRLDWSIAQDEEE